MIKELLGSARFERRLDYDWRRASFSSLSPEHPIGGATDMKGQVLASLDALEAVLQTSNLPINVKFLIEGEEEIGSPNVAPFVEANPDLLACDFVISADGMQWGEEIRSVLTSTIRLTVSSSLAMVLST